ncbi:MAG: Hsp20/alpha crystallin family protein [Nitrosomonadales bacterium]|nr:Hsp20/alpha crystallin family protein [Nitrosomonadales bacterium]
MKSQAKQNIPVKTDSRNDKPALTSLHPIAEMEHIFDRMMERLSGWRKPATARWSDFPQITDWFEGNGQRMPSLDLIDRANEIFVRAEVPGVDKKNVEVTMTDDLLTIRGNSSSETKEEKGDYHRHEISQSSFTRSILLPGSVDTSKASATLKDGVLEINLPKLESSKKRNIKIN